MGIRAIRTLALCAGVVALCALSLMGAIFMHEGGTWPSNWPEELEPLRESAFTVDISTGLQAQEYHLWFESREQFEEVWPALLRLKSKGAPIELRTPRRDYRNYQGPWRDSRHIRSPDVVIECPPGLGGSSYRVEEDGSYTHIGPWSEAIEQRDAESPKYVGKTRDREWVAYFSPYPWFVRWEEGPAVYHAARVELVLYVDGAIIDLNRTIFPVNSPVFDRREKQPED